jgi:hypothetical protein
VLVASLK